MMTIRVPRLHADDDRAGRDDRLQFQRIASHLRALVARLGRGPSARAPIMRASAEAPWVAEMLSAFGEAVMPFGDVHPNDVDRARALRSAPVDGRKLHLV